MSETGIGRRRNDVEGDKKEKKMVDAEKMFVGRFGSSGVYGFMETGSHWNESGIS